MGLTDLIWLVLIVGGTGYLLYRSFWKSKGQCACCSVKDCGKRSGG